MGELGAGNNGSVGDNDVNLHVANMSYLAWSIDSVDPATWRSSRPAAL